MARPIRSRPTPWQNIILTCGKCARKLDGGYGRDGQDKLRTVLRDGLKDAGRRRDVRVVETKCLGICPKDATTMVVTARPDVIYVVPAGTSQVEAMALALEAGASGAGD